MACVVFLFFFSNHLGCIKPPVLCLRHSRRRMGRFACAAPIAAWRNVAGDPRKCNHKGVERTTKPRLCRTKLPRDQLRIPSYPLVNIPRCNSTQ
ncbi:hypothetical protein C8T65DRAFT_7009 [Cerioporus squamosus]|nr:hypothetical protein C8T65DRAFT_7009 [Cerioporus squamosus]